jgi:Flp pilus assembly protein TadD
MRLLLFVVLLFSGLNISAQSPTVSRLFSEGTKQANAGQFADALKNYKTALFAAENEYVGANYLSRVRYNIGVCHFHLGQFDLAENEFKHAILLKKDYVRAHYALGMAQTKKRAWKSATVSFTKVVEMDPKNGEAWFDLGFAKIADGNLEAAADAFRHSIEFGSVDVALSYNNVGVILALNGDLNAAEAAFENAIRASHETLREANRNLEQCRAKRVGGRSLIAEFEYARRGDALRIG